MRNRSTIIALARTAGALAAIDFAATAPRTPEQLNAYSAFVSACTDAKLDPAIIYAEAAKPDAIKPARQPKPADAATEAHKRANASTASKPGNGAKPEAKAKPAAEKPSKPADEAKAAAASEREKLIDGLRDLVAKLYAGPSPAIRSNPKRFPLSVYVDLLTKPKHRTDLARVSERDNSGLYAIINNSARDGSFDPTAINLDAGIFSRLASVAFIESAPATAKHPFRLSKRGAEHAKLATKRAA